MKRLLFFFMALGLSISFCQDNPVDPCKKYRSLAYVYYNQNQFQDASGFWQIAFDTCGQTPNLDANFFSLGSGIYRGMLKETPKDTERFKEVKDSLGWVYQQYIIVDNDPSIKLRYANFLMYHKDTDYDRLDQLYQVVDSLKEETPARHLKLKFQHIILNRYNNLPTTEKNEGKLTLLNAYFILWYYAHLAEKKAIETNNLEEVNNYKETKSFLVKYAERVNYELPLLEKEFEKALLLLDTDDGFDKEGLNELIKVAEKLNYSQSDGYRKMVRKSVELAPSVAGYMALSKLEASSGNQAEAIEVLEKALQLPDATDEVKYELALNYYQLKMYTKAFAIAMEISGELKGKALKLAGDCVAAKASSCGNSTFERKSNYWLANDFYKQAAAAGEQVSTSQFSKNWPTASECFNEGVKMGDVIHFDCWTQTTIVR